MGCSIAVCPLSPQALYPCFGVLRAPARPTASSPVQLASFSLLAFTGRLGCGGEGWMFQPRVDPDLWSALFFFFLCARLSCAAQGGHRHRGASQPAVRYAWSGAWGGGGRPLGRWRLRPGRVLVEAQACPPPPPPPHPTGTPPPHPRDPPPRFSRPHATHTHMHPSRTLTLPAPARTKRRCAPAHVPTQHTHRPIHMRPPRVLVRVPPAPPPSPCSPHLHVQTKLSRCAATQ